MDIYGNSIVIRSKTFKAWLISNFKRQELKEMVQYGTSTGYPGLIHPADLGKVYARFKDEIQACLRSSGLSLAGFVERLEPYDMQELEEKLTWHAAEFLAWEIIKER